ncbi:hypothetical protein [Mesorhizobium humile]|uniref:Uncharacterized protein n=1 Tax=Mesorhizobium humile TaxID=3072313 RepID=A0ABU4YT82_9HYPH|nr:MULTISPECIES: hypothetical protein [unclassified Mesorhizobium]MDX8462468.1 hypothetical protein [Mesorhizobium sp. VK2D]MDX8489921.1 hypothetical protein [Mesorhizobium sp. VK2B]
MAEFGALSMPGRPAATWRSPRYCRQGYCVDALALRIEAALDRGKLPNVAKLRSEFLSTVRSRVDVTIPPPDFAGYNHLLANAQVL